MSYTWKTNTRGEFNLVEMAQVKQPFVLLFFGVAEIFVLPSDVGIFMELCSGSNNLLFFHPALILRLFEIQSMGSN